MKMTSVEFVICMRRPNRAAEARRKISNVLLKMQPLKPQGKAEQSELVQET